MTKAQTLVLKALKRALIHLVRILLRYQIDCRQFMEIAKLAFVDVGINEYGIRGRRTNLSRVAVMTGLTRKEVSRLKDLVGDNDDVSDAPPGLTKKVLDGWRADSDFIGKNGKPSTIEYEGGAGSFQELTKRYAGDVPPGALRTELKRIGAINETNERHLTLVQEHTVVEDDAEILIKALAILETAARAADNYANPDTDDWTVRYVGSGSVRNADLPQLRKVAGKRIESEIESLKDLYQAYDDIHAHSDGPMDNSIGALYLHIEEPSA